MSKEIDREEYLIVFGYALLAFTLISEPFVFQFTPYENVRIYGYLLFLIGAITLAVMLNKQEVKQHGILQIHKINAMSSTKRRNANK